MDRCHLQPAKLVFLIISTYLFSTLCDFWVIFYITFFSTTLCDYWVRRDKFGASLIEEVESQALTSTTWNTQVFLISFYLLLLFEWGERGGASHWLEEWVSSTDFRHLKHSSFSLLYFYFMNFYIFGFGWRGKGENIPGWKVWSHNQSHLLPGECHNPGNDQHPSHLHVDDLLAIVPEGPVAPGESAQAVPSGGGHLQPTRIYHFGWDWNILYF